MERALLQKMTRAAPAEKRDELLSILNVLPFAVGQCPRGAAGLCTETGAIVLSKNLLRHSDIDVLSVYLHETVHAGYWSSGRQLRRHDEVFCATEQFAFAEFGMIQTEKGRDYATRETPERLAKRAPSGVFMLAVPMLFGGGLWAIFNGLLSIEQLFLLLGAGTVLAVLEKVRQMKA